MRVTYPSHEDPAASPFEFEWEVAEGGYRWQSAIPADPRGDGREPRLFLTDGRAMGVPYMAWRYAPLRRNPGLFRTFADLEPTREAVLSFANEFGLLGGEASCMIALPQMDNERGGITVDIGAQTKYFVADGETLAVWAQQISDLRATVELWLAATMDHELFRRGSSGVRTPLRTNGTNAGR